MRAVDILQRKRHGQELSHDEIAHLVNGFTAGEIPDYQASAFLMAVAIHGMTTDETRALTEIMLESGTILDLSEIGGTKVDKHSTGGVGDKTSLVVAPLAAAAGLKVPMISGRALGHTGGTLDKLESIPGFDVALDETSFRRVLKKVGCVIVGQTETIAPADRKLYALRDVTATVDSLPLITGSILSKKLAEGISALVLDVKFGSGAVMKTLEEADALATLLIETAAHMGKNAVALLTDMNQPLGTHVGNALEVEESVAVLSGQGPDDLTDLSVQLTAHMLFVGRLADSIEDGERTAREKLASGAGLDTFQAMVSEQGGDLSRLPRARARTTVTAKESGYVTAIQTEHVGRAAMVLGAGRRTLEDTIDPAAGIVVHRKLGSEVHAGEPLVTLHHDDATRLADARTLAAGAFLIQDVRPRPRPLVERVLFSES